MGMRRETRAAKGKNKLSIETNSMLDTEHIGSGKIVEELESVEVLKSKIIALEKINTNLQSEIKVLTAKLLPITNDREIEIKKLNLKIEKLEGEVKNLSSKESTTKSPIKDKSDEMMVLRNKDLLSVDASKMFNAILSEEKIQGTGEVKLSRKDMVEKYNVNEPKVTRTRDALFENGFIDVIKSGPNRYLYKTLKALPVF